MMAGIRGNKSIQLAGQHAIAFNEKEDLLFMRAPLPFHANGMRLSALDKDGRVLLTQIYYSIGGGFVVTDTELLAMQKQKKQASAQKVPYPFASAKEMLAMAASSGLTIAQMKRANEELVRSREDLDAGLDRIWDAMLSCIDRGLRQDGQLPGGAPVLSRSVGAWTQESKAAEILKRTEKDNPGVQIGSYPFFREGRVGANFVVRSVSADDLKACCDSLTEGLTAGGHVVTPGGI